MSKRPKIDNKAAWKEIEKAGLLAVEIKTGAEDQSAWYSLPGNHRNVEIRDGQFQPTIDVTVHHKNGKRESRKKTGSQVYSRDPDKAREAAEQEAQEMAELVRRKGVPVIMDTIAAEKARRSHYYVPSIELPSFEPSDSDVAKDVLLMIGVCLFACILLSGVLYLMSINPLNPLGLP